MAGSHSGSISLKSILTKLYCMTDDARCCCRVISVCIRRSTARVTLCGVNNCRQALFGVLTNKEPSRQMPVIYLSSLALKFNRGGRGFLFIDGASLMLCPSMKGVILCEHLRQHKYDFPGGSNLLPFLRSSGDDQRYHQNRRPWRFST